MVYDEFTDSASSFSELEMRLSHLQPAELLYPQGSSKALESTLTEWKRYRSSLIRHCDYVNEQNSVIMHVAKSLYLCLWKDIIPV